MEIHLFLKRHHYQLMLEDVISRVPNEACGMIAGQEGYSEKVYSVTNISNSPVRFRMAPEEQLNAFNEMEDLGLELLAIYHSHPNGPVEPSTTDVNEFAYTGITYLIWSRVDNHWVCRSFIINDQRVNENPLIILENE